MSDAAGHHPDSVAGQADLAQAQQCLAMEVALAGDLVLQGLPRDQFQYRPIGSVEIHRLRLPHAAQLKALAPILRGKQRAARTDPVRCGVEARRRHVEGQMHAAHRLLRLHAFQRAPADANAFAVQRQLQYVAIETPGEVGARHGNTR